jgi:hypothetical protein
MHKILVQSTKNIQDWVNQKVLIDSSKVNAAMTISSGHFQLTPEQRQLKELITPYTNLAALFPKTRSRAR